MTRVLLYRNYYKEEAILRHDESLDTVFLLLENLNKFNFALVLKDKELERPRYWDLAPVHRYTHSSPPFEPRVRLTICVSRVSWQPTTADRA